MGDRPIADRRVQGVSVTEVARQHGFHPLRVAEVVDETPDAKTFVFDVPVELAEQFRYRAGQFCNVRIDVGDEEVVRCYSMSSAPSVDPALAVTVKRVEGGVVSNWLHDHVRPGATLEVSPPGGHFVLDDSSTAPLVAFCGGSGVTPVFSLVKEALASTSRPVRLLYANRDAGSVIFHAALDRLVDAHQGRLQVRHHLDSTGGFLTADDIVGSLGGSDDIDVYVCGPTPFMDIVEAAAARAAIDPARVTLERFTPGAAPVAVAEVAPADWPEQLTIVLKGKRHQLAYVAGDTVLDTARRGGLKPPYSCELGNCASCMALVKVGHVSMRANNALSAAEVEEGWVLTCQGIPSGERVVVEYEHL